MKTFIFTLMALLFPTIAMAQTLPTFKEPPDKDGLVNYCEERSYADGKPWEARPVSCVDMESVMIKGSAIDEWLKSFGYSFKYGFDANGTYHAIFLGDLGKTHSCSAPWGTCFVLEKEDIMGETLEIAIELANLRLEQALKDDHEALKQILGF